MSYINKKPLVAIIGPTGAGKSNLAMYLSPIMNGEIINADSRQVYRCMDIGTAKPSARDMALLPHHLFNLINPDEDFSLGRYLTLAKKSIQDIHQRNKIPFLVGGSGQYIWALLEGWRIPHILPDLEFRKRLESLADKKGIDELYRELQEVDPPGAARIDRRNIRRVIRALEVYYQSGKPFSQQRTKRIPRYEIIIIGLTTERKELYRRLDSRVDRMIQEGLVDEIRNLIDNGYSLDLPSMNSIGYKQIGRVLRHEISLEEAVNLIKVDNHRFVRHQYAWFKLRDPRIHWFDIRNDIQVEILQLLVNLLGDS
jgi:tRNA dimethylallyltransferase